MRAERDAERLIDRGEQIQWRNGPFQNPAAVLFTGSDDLPTLHASPGKHDRKTVRPVIAAGMSVNQRCPTKLTRTKDQNVIEHSSL